jgi:glyoxylase-like metal-dependent hydrolase (beta-lactamase superfamily II)
MSVQHQAFLARRKFCLCCLGISALSATGSWLTPAETYAAAMNIVDMIRASAATTPITTYKLRGNIALLEGSGGNIGVLTGKDGRVLVDAGITASRPRILEALNALSAGPITHLINTHWHFDHTDGNTWLSDDGAAIVAHENTLKHLAMPQRVADWSFTFPSTPTAGLPTEVFSESTKLHVNGTTLALDHYAPAHTDSDISVRFEETDVLHVGDTYWNGIYPFIDYSTGGNIKGSIVAADRNIANATDATVIIPGHGYPVSNRAEMIEYRDMLAAILENVSRLKSSGMSVEETVAERPTKKYDEKWGQFVVTPALFTRLVYEGA